MKDDNVKKYERNSSLITKKIMKFIPVNIFSQMSAVILTLVDGIIVGNLIGEMELQATVLARPFNLFTGAITLIFSLGIATNLSICIGKNNKEGLENIYRNCRFIISVVNLITFFLSILIAFILLKSYNLSSEMFDLSLKYMIGLIVSILFGFISSIGVAILNAYGKVKLIFRETIVENAINIVLDLFFICVLNMGILGASFGTCIAIILRAVYTWYHLKKHTNVLNEKSIKPNSYFKKIFHSGYAGSLTYLQTAVESWFLMWLINNAIGSDGLTTYSILSICTTIVFLFVNAVKNAIAPILGLLYGIEDRKGIKFTLSKGLQIGFCITFFVSIIINVFPSQIAMIYGVGQISENTLYAIRIYILFYLLQCIITIIKAYFTAIMETKSTLIITIVNGIFPQIPIGLTLFYICGGTAIWWLEPIAAVVATIVSIVLILKIQKREKKLYEKNMILTFSLSQNDGGNISEKIYQTLNENNLSLKNVTRITLMVEELVENAKRYNSKEIKIDIGINLFQDYCKIAMLDNGKHIDLIEAIKNENSKEEFLESYMIGKIADDVSYQWILDMNYTTIRVNLNE